MVAEGEEGAGRCCGSRRATTQFCLTGSVVMLEPGTEARTRGEKAARDGVFEAPGLREGLVTMEMRDESESSDQPGPVGEKRASRFARVTAAVPAMHVYHCSGHGVAVRSVGGLLCSSVSVLGHC